LLLGFGSIVLLVKLHREPLIRRGGEVAGQVVAFHPRELRGLL